jgi:hypothetical protein
VEQEGGEDDEDDGQLQLEVNTVAAALRTGCSGDTPLSR